MIDYLEDNAEKVIYFYLDYRDQRRQTGKLIVGSFLKQLLFHSQVIPPSILALYDESIRSGNRPSFDSLLGLLKSIVRNWRTFVVLDGLDECLKEQRQEIILIMKQLAGVSVKIFLTSRPHLYLKNLFDTEFESCCSEIDIHSSYDDILGYINLRLESQNLSSSLKSKISEAIMSASRGM